MDTSSPALPPPTERTDRPPGGFAAAPRGRWIPRAAALTWLASAVVTLAVTLTGNSLPVGDGATDWNGLWSQIPAATLTPWTAVLAVTGAAVALWTWWGGRGTRVPRATRAATVVAAVLVLAGAVTFVDASILAQLGYLPVTLVMAPFDADLRQLFIDSLTDGSALQAVALAAAALLAATTVRFVRRTGAACPSCGRRHDGCDPLWTAPAASARWGTVAAWVAAVIPVAYASTRIAWVLGVPLGVSPDFIADLSGGDGWIAALGLGAAATLGGLLTIGLTRRWGEVFPWWTLWLRGRRVPIMLAVVPATIVAGVILPAGLSLIATGVRTGALAHAFTPEGWGAIAPELLWPLWSAALGAATYAYWLRRRGTCRSCGLG